MEQQRQEDVAKQLDALLRTLQQQQQSAQRSQHNGASPAASLTNWLPNCASPSCRDIAHNVQCLLRLPRLWGGFCIASFHDTRSTTGVAGGHNHSPWSQTVGGSTSNNASAGEAHSCRHPYVSVANPTYPQATLQTWQPCSRASKTSRHPCHQTRHVQTLTHWQHTCASLRSSPCQQRLYLMHRCGCSCCRPVADKTCKAVRC